MKITDLKFLAILILLGVSCIVSWNTYFREYVQEDTVNIHRFPDTIQGWEAKELTITDEEYEILETRNAFVREYTNPDGLKVYLFIVYSESNRKVSHPPEVCYQGSGQTLAQKVSSEVSIPGRGKPLETFRLLLEGKNYEQTAHYFFKVGNQYTRSYWKQQILIALKSLLGQPASSALIRVSAVIDPGNPARSREMTEDFLRIIVPKFEEYLP